MSEQRKKTIKNAFLAAFPTTLPILAGYVFLGMTYGVYMHIMGFSFVYPMLMAWIIYGGSLEFVACSLLLAPFAPVQTFVVAFLIQARHLFYGISMLDRYKGLGLKKYYLIFGMSDETFALNYSTELPQEVDRGWFMVFVTMLDRIYWVGGATLGGILGALATDKFNLTGLEFVMTAMFVVIFLEQWFKEKTHGTALLGLGISALCLCIFGANSFLIPTMLCLLVVLGLLRRPLEKAGEGA